MLILPPDWLMPLLLPVSPGRGMAVGITAALLVVAVSRLGDGGRLQPPG